MEDKVEIIRSNKGGLKLIHRGYMYTVHKKRQGGGIRWRCTQRSLHCKGSISTGSGVPRVNMPHNHIPDPHSVALARCRQFDEYGDVTPFLQPETKGAELSKRASSYSELWEQELPCRKSAKGTSFAHCLMCQCDIDVSNKGKGDFAKHTRTDKHRANRARFQSRARTDEQISTQSMAQQKLGVAHEDYAPQLDNRVLSIMEAILLEGNTESEHKEIRIIDDDSLQERLVQQQQSILGTPPPPATVTKAPPVAQTPPPPPPLKQVPSKPASIPKVVHPPPSVQITPQHSNVQYTPTINQDLEKDPDEVCLRWNSHHSNMKNSFPSLLEKEQYVDVTLCSEGQTIRCHRLILSSCSAYFDEILSGITPIQHPVIFLKGTPFWILKSLIDFMYVGEVHIEQCKLQEILDVAEALKIKGLTGKNPHHNIKEESRNDDGSSPPGKRNLPPLRLAVSKEQAANMQTIDPMSLLTPTFYEENVPHYGRKQPTSPKGKFQTLVPLSDKQREWLSKKLIPKRRLKRKSTDHEPSPPPVLLRKGTKSRPVVKAPKYYHNEYEENDGKMVKLEVDGEEDEHNTTDEFDISNVKSEPLDIEENDVAYDHFLSTGTIKFGNSVGTLEENNYQPTDHPPNEEANEEKGRSPEQGPDSGEDDRQGVEENDKHEQGDEGNEPLTINEEKMEEDFKDKDSGDDMDHQDDDEEEYDEINMGVEVDVNVDIEESDVNVDAND